MIRLTKEQIKTELLLARNEEGKIDAKVIVDNARPEDAPLHHMFEWDNEIAAEQYRYQQARQYIQHYVVLTPGERTTYSLSSERRDGGGYRDLDEVLSTAELRKVAVQDALKELVRWRERHQHLTEFKALFEVIDAVVRDTTPPDQPEEKKPVVQPELMAAQ